LSRSPTRPGRETEDGKRSPARPQNVAVARSRGCCTPDGRAVLEVILKRHDGRHPLGNNLKGGTPAGKRAHGRGHGCQRGWGLALRPSRFPKGHRRRRRRVISALGDESIGHTIGRGGSSRLRRSPGGYRSVLVAVRPPETRDVRSSWTARPPGFRRVVPKLPAPRQVTTGVCGAGVRAPDLQRMPRSLGPWRWEHRPHD